MVLSKYYSRAEIFALHSLDCLWYGIVDELWKMHSFLAWVTINVFIWTRLTSINACRQHRFRYWNQCYHWDIHWWCDYYSALNTQSGSDWYEVNYVVLMLALKQWILKVSLCVHIIRDCTKLFFFSQIHKQVVTLHMKL